MPGTLKCELITGAKKVTQIYKQLLRNQMKND